MGIALGYSRDPTGRAHAGRARRERRGADRGGRSARRDDSRRDRVRIAVVVFTIVFALIQPFLAVQVRRAGSAALGGVALIATLVSLIG
jgi:hypothetical protein